MTQSTDHPQTVLPASLQTSTLAIVSLIAGIASWLIVPVIGAIVAVVAGHRARKEIRSRPEELTGNGLATIGLVLGYANLLVGCALLVIVVLTLSGPGLEQLFSGVVNEIATPVP
jgi:heme/copper-type cytochrome/quinol oxidase subunit 2